MSDIKSLNAIIDSTKSMSILYVEDDKLLHESTKKLLENFFNIVDTSFDGEDGLKKYLSRIEKCGDSYDIVITDIRMPFMNGIDMSKEIIKKEPSQMIIVTSADDSYDETIRELYIGLLPKPAGGHQFSSLIYNISKSIQAAKSIY